MNELINELHWLRPLWLLGLVPATIIAILLIKRQLSNNSWRRVIAPELLSHLIEGSHSPARKRGIIALLIAWLIACIALAGPVWEKLPVPIHKKESALVILMDLSPSILAEDIKPSRLIRARHKLIDLLRARKEGLSALIAYAGEAHVVAPLTDDTATLESLLPALHPNIMPLRGNNPEAAVEKALALFKDAGLVNGDILFVTDEIPMSATADIRALIEDSAVRLSILGVGTEEGAPIPFGQGGFAKDSNGNIVIASLNRSTLQRLARQLDGRYSDLRADNKDLDWLSDLPDPEDEQTRMLEREFDSWHEYGHWLALLLLPLIAYCFRRGLLLGILILPLAGAPESAMAYEWRDLWYNKDQQGMRSMSKGDPESAATEFENPQWRGTAQYRAGDYAGAADSFAQGEEPEDDYNRGNALARAMKLDEALEAYDKALAKQPDYEDAQFNRDLVEQLKQQQEQEQEQQEQEQQNQDQQDQQDQGQQDQNQQGENQQQQEGQEGQDDQNQQGQDSESQDSKSQEEKEQEKQSAKEQEQQAAEEEKKQEEAEQKQAEQSQSEDGEKKEQQAEAQAQEGELDPEQQQALEQWLRKVPDDPGGLLRRKFQHQHRELRKEYQRGDWAPPDNNALQRW